MEIFTSTETILAKVQNVNSFKEKQGYPHRFCSDEGFKDIVVNREYHSELRSVAYTYVESSFKVIILILQS